MELQLRRPRRRRRRTASLVLVSFGVVLAGWLAAVLALPPSLGLGTAGVGGPSGDFGAGTLVVTRSVPAADLDAHDVVSVGDGFWEISAVQPGRLDIAGAESLATLDLPPLERVVLTLPVLGWPLTGTSGLVSWVVTGLGGAVAVAAASVRGWGRRLAAT